MHSINFQPIGEINETAIDSYPVIFNILLRRKRNEVGLDLEKIPADADSVMRGAEHVVNNCVSCHSLKYIKYTDMLALGVEQATVDAWRGSNPVSARILAQMPAEAAAAAFGGIVPPDLSLMAIARDGEFITCIHT